MHQSFQSKPEKREPEFQPCQMVCLEHHNTYLYAEVVQMAKGKQVCWVRPLALIEGTSEEILAPASEHSSRLYDLRQSSDLLLPSVLFRSALDTEVIPLLSHLSDISNAEMNQTAFAQTQLNQLIKNVCLAHPELF